MKNNRLYDPAPAATTTVGGVTTTVAATTPPPAATPPAPAATPPVSTPPKERAWLDLVPEVHRADKRWEKFTGNTLEEVFPQMAERVVAADVLAGSEKILKPNHEKWTETEWKEYYKSIGVPEKAEAYKYEVPEAAAKFPVDPDSLKLATELALKNGLLPHQAKGMIEGYMADRLKRAEAAQAAADAAFEKTKTIIDKLWGDQKDQQSKLYQLALREYGKDLPADLAPLVEGLVNDTKFQESPYFPILAHVLARAGRDNLEDKAMRAGQPRPQLGKTPEQAKQELAEKKANPEWANAYRDQSHPRNKIVRQEAHALHLIIAKAEKDQPLTVG